MADPRLGAVVASATVGTTAIADWIPDGVGKIATIVGIVLSLLLIRVHYVNLKKSTLELEIMKRKEEERLEEARIIKEPKQPLRREED